MFLYFLQKKNYFLQHAENRVNTSAFARWCLKNIANTWILLPVVQNIVNTVVLDFRGTKNIGIYGVLCSESFKKTWRHHLFDRAHGNVTKRCVVVTSCGMSEEYFTMLCAPAGARVRRAHQQHQHSHYQHNPHGLMASPVWEALQLYSWLFFRKVQQ